MASIANFSIFDIAGAFEDTSFASLAELVSEHTLKGVKEMGFEHMTEIQHKSIRPLLEGRSVPPQHVALFEGTYFAGGVTLLDGLTLCVCAGMFWLLRRPAVVKHWPSSSPA